MAVIVSSTGAKFLAADRVWISTALLHKENPRATAFTPAQIIARGQREGFVETGVNTFSVHVNQHCVANRSPNPGRHRMLIEEGDLRRLYRPGDRTHPGRTGKAVPERKDIPTKYHHLLDWYQRWAGSSKESQPDPLLILRKISKGIWKEEDPLEYQKSLRAGWR